LGSEHAPKMLHADSLGSTHLRLLKENRQRMKTGTVPQTVFDEERLESSFFEPQPEPSSSQRGCPVFVMLPLDTVWVIEREGRKISILKKERSLEIALHTLKQAGVEGVMVDVWWGLVERAGPRSYDFSAYDSLFKKVQRAGLKVQAVMSFHAAGGNVGDTCKIPLPKWILDIGDKDPDIYYTDKSGHRNRECLSLGCDEMPIFWGRTPVEMYSDFIEAFAERFHPLFGECMCLLILP
jgi:beta-amylase